MAFFIFQKNSDGVENTLYKIAENQSDLDSLNIVQTLYKIIEDNQDNFNAVKFGTKQAISYNNNIINYVNVGSGFNLQKDLQAYIVNYVNIIQLFLNDNPNSPVFNRWNNYKNQLNNLNLSTITYPLNISLEQYFDNLGQPSYISLQLP